MYIVQIISVNDIWFYKFIKSFAAVYGESYKLNNTSRKHVYIATISIQLLCIGQISIFTSVRHGTCTTAYCLHSTVITPIFKISNRGWCTCFSPSRHKFKPGFRKHVSVVMFTKPEKWDFHRIVRLPKSTTQDYIKLEIAAVLQNSSNRGDTGSRRM
ncbi:hypothetical protein DPMN_135071 [Dreissena polymorpha]|uniref:Uncharacterized protein n=1 Tax=Dreissena polymorpha TaxID=45954 RepID=A0A9D4G380_DREPO|nr:hypothetical protein DPMN_135071 [Dreissena polymorpha]